MMELSLKSKTIKKKHKKKKIRVPESALLPILKPGVSNADSNWLRLQKQIVKPEKRESLKTNTKRNMLNITGINLSSKDYKPPFSQKASFYAKNSTPQDKGLLTRVKSDKKFAVQDKCSNVETRSVNPNLPGNSKIAPNGDQTHQFEFSFNTSVHNSPAKEKSGHETRSIESPKGNKERKLTRAVAMDCEMVGTGPKGESSIIARVSIVNSHGDCLYDEFVKPKEKVTDFRTQISGVRPSDLKNGKDLFDVQKDVLSIIEGRILVGHSIKHDLQVLFISHPHHLIRDTAFYKPFREICGGKTPSLKKLTSKILGCEIQSGEHSSVEDAQAAMLLYLRQRREWESLIKSQRKRKPKLIENQTSN